LLTYDRDTCPLPGVRKSSFRASFVEQLVESIRRIKYVSVIGTRPLSKLRTDPSSDLFDPIRAAVLHKLQGNFDEAFWLVFLFVHFGKDLRTGWRLVRDIYGGLGGPLWDWTRASINSKELRKWLEENEATLRGGDGIKRRFGNHRKYETLKSSSDRAPGKVIESYVAWVHPPRTHQVLVQDSRDRVGSNPRRMFDHLYISMDKIVSFGRTARFDYLTMIGKTGLAPIEPASAYLQGANGPLDGARLLFGKDGAGAATLDPLVLQLEAHLGLNFGMQVLEDALCNWQKSPGKFRPFRG